MQDVFISYSSKEYDVANIVRTTLTNNGITSWMAPESIPGGSNYMEVIPRAIADCKIFVLILSESSQKSKWVPKEIEQALNNNLIIIPFQIEKCEISKMFNFIIGNSQRIIAYMSLQENLRKLVDTINSLLGKENNSKNDTFNQTTKIDTKSSNKRALASENSETRKYLELIALASPEERKIIEKMKRKGKRTIEIQEKIAKMKKK